MRINIGSKNPQKIKALKEILKEYSRFKKTKVFSFNVSSDISEQPKSLKETIRGAKNRAKNSFINCNYSFGVESGIFKVVESNSGYMDVCVCSIFDGKNFYLGFSSAWEVPKEILKYIIKENLDMNQASLKANLTKKDKVGYKEGLIGILTKGKLKRKDYTKEAIRTALICIDN